LEKFLYTLKTTSCYAARVTVNSFLIDALDRQESVCKRRRASAKELRKPELFVSIGTNQQIPGQM